MQHHLQSNSLTLSEVQKQFQLWRVNKAPGATVPESLWELVRQLLENASHKRSMVGKALGISTRQFRDKFPGQFKTSPTKIPTLPKTTKPFVQAPLGPFIGPQSSSSPHCIIERTNGTKLIFSAVTQEQFSVLIKTWME